MANFTEIHEALNDEIFQGGDLADTRQDILKGSAPFGLPSADVDLDGRLRGDTRPMAGVA